MQVHEYAKFFPLMEGEEFDALVQDIKAHGLLEPIMILDDKILDGRNRYRACQKAGVTPKFQKYSGNGVLSYVVSMNVKRRHLSKDQLGIIAQDMLPAYEKEASDRQKADARLGTKRHGRPSIAMPTSRDAVGKALGISGTVVDRVKRVSRDAPDLIPKIRSGEMTAFQAAQEARFRIAKVGVAKQANRRDQKKLQEHDGQVKAYLVALVSFGEAVTEATKAAKFGKFSPEGKKFTVRRHDHLRGLLGKLEEAFNA